MSFKSVFFVFCVVASLVIITEAQLTFTSSWGGKRSGGSIAGTVNCRNEEAISAIYKLIQGEAEKLLFCQKP